MEYVTEDWAELGWSAGGSTDRNSSMLRCELVKPSRLKVKKGACSTVESNPGETDMAKEAAGLGDRDTRGGWIKAVVRSERSACSMMMTVEIFSEVGSNGQAWRPCAGWNGWSKLSA